MINVACIQPEVLQNREKCYFEVETLLKKLIQNRQKLDIVCLPERWVPFELNFSNNFQVERGSDYLFIKKLAYEYSINIISGAIWEKRKKNFKPAITSYYFNNRGEEIGRQDKIHLYSYEKQQFNPSQELKIFKLNSNNFSILICFDMAFFETPRLAAEYGADILFSPTQIREEGMENWEIYLRARALENRIPVVGCNTFGYFFKRKFPGNSKIISFIKGHISPSKLKITEGPFNSNGYLYDNIDLSFPRKIRKLRFKEIKEKNKINVKKI